MNRAIERGIGEICLRPENCHHEIREPVRSIATPKPPQPKDRSSSAFGAATMAASAKRRTKIAVKCRGQRWEAPADAVRLLLE